MSVETLKREYQKLSLAEQVEFDRMVLEKYQPEDDLSGAWRAEIERRIADYDTGSIQTVPLKSFLQELRNRR